MKILKTHPMSQTQLASDPRANQDIQRKDVKQLLQQDSLFPCLSAEWVNEQRKEVRTDGVETAIRDIGNTLFNYLQSQPSFGSEIPAYVPRAIHVYETMVAKIVSLHASLNRESTSHLFNSLVAEIDDGRNSVRQLEASMISSLEALGCRSELQWATIDLNRPHCYTKPCQLLRPGLSESES